jgi:hypothetical protein
MADGLMRGKASYVVPFGEAGKPSLPHVGNAMSMFQTILENTRAASHPQRNASAPRITGMSAGRKWLTQVV